MEEFFKEFLGKFMRDNADDLAGVPKDLINAGISTGIAEVIPDKYMTPSLNNMRMKYASEALKYTAHQKSKMDNIRARLKKQVVAAMWKALGSSILGAL